MMAICIEIAKPVIPLMHDGELKSTRWTMSWQKYVYKPMIFYFVSLYIVYQLGCFYFTHRLMQQQFCVILSKDKTNRSIVFVYCTLLFTLKEMSYLSRKQEVRTTHNYDVNHSYEFNFYARLSF